MLDKQKGGIAMKIKYSNQARESLSSDLLKEIIQISYSLFPHAKYHCFSFTQLSNDQVSITHYAHPNICQELIRPIKYPIPKEPVYIIFYKKEAYIAMKNEIKSLFNVL